MAGDGTDSPLRDPRASGTRHGRPHTAVEPPESSVMERPAAGGDHPRAVLAPGARRHGHVDHRAGPRAGRAARAGAGRRERPPPIAARRAVRPADRRCGTLPLPRPVLYETWHALRWPPVERATGPVDVVHATAVAIPPDRRPLVVTIHDLAFLAEPDRATRHGHRFFRRGLELARRHAALVLCPSEATIAECIAAGFDADRLRLVPWGVGAAPVDAGGGRAGPRGARARPRPYVLFVGTAEPRKNLGALVDGVPRPRRPRRRPGAGRPDGWNEDLDARIRPLGRGPAGSGFVRRRPTGRALRRLRGVLLPEPAGGLRPAGARGDGPRARRS